MNRLQTELHRLYHAPNAPPGDSPLPDGPAAVADSLDLIDPHGRVRALVLELARPADWGALSAVWQGVQADLALPAPAIAVSGIDGYQLWFSLAEAVPVAEAWAFLEGLRLRYLGHIAPGRLRLLPSADPSTAPAKRHARPVPALQQDTGRWSAFVAPDLAAVFSDDPWLDLCPSPDAQADVLARLACIKLSAFEVTLQQLQPTAPSLPAAGTTTLEQAAPPALTMAERPPGQAQGPRQFLLQLMNDPSVETQWRLEAAKALLPYLES